jgi:hypothetical protein
MPANNPPSLGAWEPERESIVNAPVPTWGDVEEFSDVIRFQINVARLIRRREINASAEPVGCAVFVLVDRVTQHALSKEGGRTLDRLIHTGAKRLTGRVHFVNPSAQSSVFEEFTGSDSEMLDRLDELKLADLPAMIYMAQDPESSLSYYPRGTAEYETVVPVRLGMGTVSQTDVLNVIESVYKTELVTPANTGPYKIWEDADRGRPFEHAERGIQQFVRIGLATGFSWCKIRAEQPDKDGRTDLEIVDTDSCGPGVTVHHALLELKVLRSRGATGTSVSQSDMEQHIREGVEQAHSYGTSRNSLERMLCCFDMRDADFGDEAAFAHVKDAANTFNVSLNRWFLYRSPELMRAAQAAATLAAAPPAAAQSA